MAKTNGNRTIRKVGIISGVVASTLVAVVIYTSVVLFAGEQSSRIEVIEVRYGNVEKRLDRQEKKLDQILELLRR